MCAQEEEIKKMLETKRESLHVLILQHGINSIKTLKCSEELDELIFKEEMILLNKKASTNK
ncbi:MAG: aspartyl-phosphate phosphatase Spo0E family protein [Clostridiales bacterium]|nr:aspartyl-phosphate phosphatase Spo0E family protein [Clostridiales bacterium]